jgi:DNA polymerase (family 10)
MTNAEIAAVFYDIAVRLKAKKENIFKIRAYEKAAKAIEEFSVPVERLAKEDRLREVSGVGDAIEKEISELVNTGRLEFYEKLKN